jgi:hypothetical protein
MKKWIAVGVACLGILAIAAWAADEIRQETVQFKKGKSSATLKGHIKGYDSVDYRLGIRAGQMLAVTLKSGNRFNYFNILPPGDDSALFIGSTSGNTFSGILPKNGDYTVRVYLMRNAARRNETADYKIDFKISDSGSSKGEAAFETGPKDYDASGTVRCSANEPALGSQCEFRVVRDPAGHSAEIWIENIAFANKARCRVLYYAEKVFTTTDSAAVSCQRKDDNWLVSVEGKEFYFIPDALIHGG